MIIIKRIYTICFLSVCMTVVSSCISVGRDLSTSYPSSDCHYISDTIFTSDNDSIKVQSDIYYVISYNGKKNSKPKCCPNDTVGYYYPYQITISSPVPKDFTILSFSVKDENGTVIPFVPFLGVTVFINKNAYIMIDSIPYKSAIGSSFDMEKYGKEYVTYIYFEICKPYRDIERMEIQYSIKINEIVKEYRHEFKKKWWVEFRPKIF